MTSSRARSMCSATGVEAVLESDGLRVGMGVGAILRWLSRWLPVEQTPRLVREGQGARWDQDCPPWDLASTSCVESGWGLGAPPGPSGARPQLQILWARAPSGPGERDRCTCSGDKHQRSAVRLGEWGGALLGSGALLTPPTEAWGCYLHGREEERFGVR